jgi:hypothetical protein
VGDDAARWEPVARLRAIVNRCLRRTLTSATGRSSLPPGVIRPGLPRSSIVTGCGSIATASAGPARQARMSPPRRFGLPSRRRFDCSRDDAGPWLFGIATNLLRSRLRADTRRTRALARLHQHDEADVADGALDRVEAQALGPHVAAALRQLSPIYRDALLLHVWGELSYEQVAEATHVSCCSWAPPASWRSAAAHGRRRAAAHPFRWQSRRRGWPGVVRPRWRRARRWSGWPPTCA